MVDAHVHFWDPDVLSYAWLGELSALNRAFYPADYAAATAEAGVERIIFVEGNCSPSQNVLEAERIERLADADGRIAGIVAYAHLTDALGLSRSLDALARLPRVRGIRHNIQGEPAGFCLQRSFVDGIREVGRRGLAFDICVTHDQLHDTVELARRCPDTRLVLDHCGKPAIGRALREPWRTRIAELAECANVWCKLSGLLTEAEPAGWRAEDVLSYAQHVVDCFGAGRVIYGSDWPVLTLAGAYADWLELTRRLTLSWSPADQRRFYHDNAIEVYAL